MKTYQDLLDIGLYEENRISFVENAISEHKSSAMYRTAKDAYEYYNGVNPTITKYEKVIYDALGKAHVNKWTANHKIKSQFFPFAVDQEVSYLLSNGIMVDSPKLTNDFEEYLQEAATDAIVGGVCFCYPELQSHVVGESGTYKLKVFPVTEFVPLYDEETGALKAGIRFWQVANDKPLRATLYEEDGFTEYMQKDGESMSVLREKQPYKTVKVTSVMDGTEIMPGEPFPGFPIVPFKNNERQLSEIIGKRSTIDALDLVLSQMVNDVDDGNLVYWVLQNYQGMDGLDDARFWDELHTTGILHIEGDDAKAEPHTVEAPYAGTQTAIDMLNKRAFTDFQAFDSSAVSAGNQTATAIKASYVPLDLKTDRFERQVTKFLTQFFALIGETAKPTFTRNKIINVSEEIQTVIMSAQYLSDEYVTEKVLTFLGDADKLEEVTRQKEETEMSRIEEIPDETDETVKNTDENMI